MRTEENYEREKIKEGIRKTIASCEVGIANRQFQDSVCFDQNEW